MNFKDVFDAHPEAEKIFVVDGMPFLNKVDALNFASGDESKVETKPRLSVEVVEDKKNELKAKAEAEAKAKA